MNNNSIRVMLDMSATLIHHGHVRLIKRQKSISTLRKLQLLLD